MIWNDLKANLIFSGTTSIQLETVKRSTNPQHGQISGLQITLIKQSASIIHEFLNFLKHPKFKPLLETDAFKEALRNADTETKSLWKILLDSSNNIFFEENYSLYLKNILRLRNNYTFHFQDPKGLAEGYITFFDQNPDQIRALTSIGISMEQSRFYFADAAVQGAINCLIRDTGGTEHFFEMHNKFMRAMNKCILNIVQKYLFQRKITCAPISDCNN